MREAGLELFSIVRKSPGKVDIYSARENDLLKTRTVVILFQQGIISSALELTQIP